MEFSLWLPLNCGTDYPHRSGWPPYYLPLKFIKKTILTPDPDPVACLFTLTTLVVGTVFSLYKYVHKPHFNGSSHVYSRILGYLQLCTLVSVNPSRAILLWLGLALMEPSSCSMELRSAIRASRSTFSPWFSASADKHVRMWHRLVKPWGNLSFCVCLCVSDRWCCRWRICRRSWPCWSPVWVELSAQGGAPGDRHPDSGCSGEMTKYEDCFKVRVWRYDMESDNNSNTSILWGRGRHTTGCCTQRHLLPSNLMGKTSTERKTSSALISVVVLICLCLCFYRTIIPYRGCIVLHQT